MMPGTHTYVRRLYLYSYVGIEHAAAAVELVVWGYEVYPAQQTQPGPRHRDSHRVPAPCPPAKEGLRRRRRSLTTNPWTETPAMELNRLTLG